MLPLTGLGSMVMVRLQNYRRIRALALILGFDDGSPDGNDPLQITRAMASKGITLVSSQSVKFSELLKLS